MAVAWISDIENALADLKRRELFRETRDFPLTEPPALNFASNDYLGLSQHPRLLSALQASLEQQPVLGAGAARLVSGSYPAHGALERELADFLGYEASLLFSAGYLANLGAVSALVGRGDVVCADRLVHASLLDGIRLSGAKLLRFRHNDCTDLQRCLQEADKGSGSTLVVVESIYSMNGDCAPLTEIAHLAKAHAALLLVDEAHAVGVRGPRGRGLVAELGLERDVALVTGSFGKAFGAMGGFVACSAMLRSFFVNTARSFVFNTAPLPALAETLRTSLELVAEADAEREHLERLSADFRAALVSLGLEIANTTSQIVPVILGDSGQTMALGAALREQGVLCGAIRPPTVPPGSSRLRFSLNTRMSQDDCAFVLAFLGDIVGASTRSVNA